MRMYKRAAPLTSIHICIALCISVLKQDRNNANNWKSSLSKFVMGGQSHVLSLEDNLNHFFWWGSCFSAECMPVVCFVEPQRILCCYQSRRISVGRGSTVSFSRILLNMLPMKIARNVDEVRQGIAMLQHWHLPVYVGRLSGGSE